MAKSRNNDTKAGAIKLDPAGVSQSTKQVVFVASKDSKGLEKNKEYSVSKNVAEILVLKSLGKIK